MAILLAFLGPLACLMPEPVGPCAYAVDKTTFGNKIAFIVLPVPVYKRNVLLVLDPAAGLLRLPRPPARVPRPATVAVARSRVAVAAVAGLPVAVATGRAVALNLARLATSSPFHCSRPLAMFLTLSSAWLGLDWLQSAAPPLCLEMGLPLQPRQHRSAPHLVGPAVYGDHQPEAPRPAGALASLLSDEVPVQAVTHLLLLGPNGLLGLPAEVPLSAVTHADALLVGVAYGHVAAGRAVALHPGPR